MGNGRRMLEQARMDTSSGILKTYAKGPPRHRHASSVLGTIRRDPIPVVGSQNNPSEYVLRARERGYGSRSFPTGSWIVDPYDERFLFHPWTESDRNSCIRKGTKPRMNRDPIRKRPVAKRGGWNIVLEDRHPEHHARDERRRFQSGTHPRATISIRRLEREGTSSMRSCSDTLA